MIFLSIVLIVISFILYRQNEDLNVLVEFLQKDIKRKDEIINMLSKR